MRSPAAVPGDVFRCTLEGRVLAWPNGGGQVFKRLFQRHQVVERTQQALQRSRAALFSRVTELFRRSRVDEAVWQELEELLIAADVGARLTLELTGRVRAQAEQERLASGEEVLRFLKGELLTLLQRGTAQAASEGKPPAHPLAVLVVGVNGAGKTTAIAKLAHGYQQEGRKVVLAAADTFRAAAVEQLQVWGERLGAPVIAHRPGADPGAVVFDAWQSARARGADVLLVDTAGRLHTKSNLMEELKKLRRVLQRLDPSAPHQTLLVLDATTGQNGLSQARHFLDAVGCDGVFLAKLDGTAKGGIVFAIVQELGLPVRFLGTGEGIEDVAPFDPEAFVEALFLPDRQEAPREA